MSPGVAQPQWSDELLQAERLFPKRLTAFYLQCTQAIFTYERNADLAAGARAGGCGYEKPDGHRLLQSWGDASSSLVHAAISRQRLLCQERRPLGFELPECTKIGHEDMMISVRPHHERAEIILSGAAAARDGVHRRHNPYPLAEEDWLNWMDGYDQQTVWLEQGRGVYQPFPDVLLHCTTRLPRKRTDVCSGRRRPPTVPRDQSILFVLRAALTP